MAVHYHVEVTSTVVDIVQDLMLPENQNFWLENIGNVQIFISRQLGGTVPVDPPAAYSVLGVSADRKLLVKTLLIGPVPNPQADRILVWTSGDQSGSLSVLWNYGL